MSKPIKRPMGSRTIPKWEVGQDAREFSDVRYETAEGMAKITIKEAHTKLRLRSSAGNSEHSISMTNMHSDVDIFEVTVV